MIRMEKVLTNAVHDIIEMIIIQEGWFEGIDSAGYARGALKYDDRSLRA